jgi:uncharacterized 2Fe-2S/4Fe-4S cluster protein (DUF4445 family)
MGYASHSRSQADNLKAVVVEALDALAAELCAEAGSEPRAILDAVIVGNTAMHHLLLGLGVRQLARSPYVPAVQRALDLKARDVGLRLAPGANVHTLPNVAGYVGADHVAMLLATGIHERDSVTLALDIGTNTEVCLAKDGQLTSISCASGPAFEGAHITHGMRAAEGAIEHVRLVDDQIEFQTIGDKPPVGICGSGVLDALSALHEAGVVNTRGRMQRDPRVVDTEQGEAFVLVDKGGAEKRITITQADVRELQLAKGAIRAGIELLLGARGLSAGDIDRVVVAGAFGTYIDVASAIAIGMLPDLPLDRFAQVGNAAGTGAVLALVSRRKRSEAGRLAAGIDYLELATAPKFARTFAEAAMIGRWR